MTEPSENRTLPRIFDRVPELKRNALEYLATLTEEEKERNLRLMEKFISGEMTWAEVKGIPRSVQKFLAKIGYVSFKANDLVKAETIFKGLAIMDHYNWYYRAALGAVYQRRKAWEEAVEEYSAALALKADDVTSLANRAQCYFMLHDGKAAREDCEKVRTALREADNPYAQRALALLRAMEDAGTRRAEGTAGL